MKTKLLKLFVLLTMSLNLFAGAYVYEETYEANCTGFFCNASWACKEKVKQDAEEYDEVVKEFKLHASKRLEDEDFEEDGKKYKVYGCYATYILISF